MKSIRALSILSLAILLSGFFAGAASAAPPLDKAAICRLYANYLAAQGHEPVDLSDARVEWKQGPFISRDSKDAVADKTVKALVGRFDKYYQGKLGIDQKLPIADSAFFIKDVCGILEDAKQGLMDYPPFIEFTGKMESINESLIDEVRRFDNASDVISSSPAPSEPSTTPRAGPGVREIWKGPDVKGDTAEKVCQEEGTGISVAYCFRRIGGKWYLKKIADWSA